MSTRTSAASSASLAQAAPASTRAGVAAPRVRRPGRAGRRVACIVSFLWRRLVGVGIVAEAGPPRIGDDPDPPPGPAGRPCPAVWLGGRTAPYRGAHGNDRPPLRPS